MTGMAGHVWLIRHAQASAGAADYDQLSPLGFIQAGILGTWFAASGVAVDRVVTGRMARHRQTAGACFPVLPAETDAGFDEFDRHQVLAHARDDDSMRAAVARWMSARHAGDYDEPWGSFKQRCLAALQRIDRETETAVFTSAGAIAAICHALWGLSQARTVGLIASLINCGVTRLRFDGTDWQVQSFNGFAHLQIAGRPELVSMR